MNRKKPSGATAVVAQKAQTIIPERLVEAARHRRLIPFIGAGMSRQVDPNRYPSWKELLIRMTKKFGVEGYLTIEETRSLTDMVDVGNNPQAVAETLKARVPKDAYYSFLQDQFSHIPKKPCDAHIQILELNPPVIVTTNYDKLIENAYAYSAKRALSVVTYNQPAQVRNKLLDAMRLKTPFLFKLHGDIDNPSQIILTGSDYERLKQLNGGYRLLLSSLFFHYTTLFIGFSLTDTEIMLHIRNVQEALLGERYPDYALLSEDTCSDKDAMEFRREFGIQVIRYKKHGDGHVGLPRFLLQFTNLLPN